MDPILLQESDPGELLTEVAFNDPVASLMLVAGVVLILFSMLVFGGLSAGGVVVGTARSVLERRQS